MEILKENNNNSTEYLFSINNLIAKLNIITLVD